MTITKKIDYLKNNVYENVSEYDNHLRMEIYKKHISDGQFPLSLRFSFALADFLNQKSIHVDPNDLLAGNIQFFDYEYSNPKSFQDEINAVIAGMEVDSNTLDELLRMNEYHHDGLFFRAPSGHTVPGYKSMLENGIINIIERAEKCLPDNIQSEHIMLEDIEDCKNFIKQNIECLNLNIQALSAMIVMKAFIRYIRRYIDEIDRMLEHDLDDPEQLNAVRTSLANLSQAKPASFLDAVQLLWITHEVIICEQLSGSISIGRLDEMLYPFYANDHAMDYQSALHYIKALWIKFAQLRKAYQNVTIGGLVNQGAYLCNSVTYMCMDATKYLKMDQPQLSLRWHRTMPDELAARSFDLLKEGMGFPALFGDDICMRAKQKTGVELKDCYDYAIVGCVEITIPNKEFSHTEAFRLNWAKVLSMFFESDKEMPVDESLRIKACYATFDSFYKDFINYLKHVVKFCIRNLNILEDSFSRTYKYPFMSSLDEYCLVKNKDIADGGTKYNHTGFNHLGMATLANSLQAIKDVVFINHLTGLSELFQAVENNFENENVHQYILNKVDKFGNDIDEVDMLLAETTKEISRYVSSFRNNRNSEYMNGMYTIDTHAKLGEKTKATFDGRKKGLALSNGLSPVQGTSKLGCSATINSLTKIDHTNFANGMVLDLKFAKKYFANMPADTFIGLVNTYFDKGGMELQLNVIDNKTLVDAQNYPEQHKDLIVRVSGFSAYFCDLQKACQDEIINRTELNG